MLKAGLTYEDVAAAATILSEIGQDVSVNSVRRHLGSGSRFIIGRHLARWRGEQTIQAPESGPIESDAIDTPPPRSSLAHALESLSTALQISTEAQILPLQEKAQSLSDEVAALRDAMLSRETATAERVHEVASKARSGNKNLAAKVEHINGRLDASQRALGELQRGLDDATKRWKTESEWLGAKIEEVSREHSSLMHDLLGKLQGLSEAHSTLLAALRDQQLRAQSQIAGLEERLLAATDGLNELFSRQDGDKPKKKKE